MPDSLQILSVNREPLEDVWDRDQLWERIAFGWPGELIHWLSTVDGSGAYLRSSFEVCGNRNQADLRVLICGLALRSYAVENGNPPEKLADLVPDHLSEVPADPFSGKPLVYRREAKGYVLYSVGSDGRDDGGQLHGYSNPGTDILLDHPPEGQEE